MWLGSPLCGSDVVDGGQRGVEDEGGPAPGSTPGKSPVFYWERRTGGSWKGQNQEENQGRWTIPAPEFAPAEVTDWSQGGQVPSVPIQQILSGTEGNKSGPIYQAVFILSNEMA